MAAMAILVFLAHGAHDHVGHASGSHGGHDHTGPLKTVLSAGFTVGVLVYLGLSVVLTVLIMRGMRRNDVVAAKLLVELQVQQVPAGVGAVATARPAVAAVDLGSQPSVSVGHQVAKSGVSLKGRRAQVHEVLAQSIAVVAMLLMML